jgi:hypothetical protein
LWPVVSSCPAGRWTFSGSKKARGFNRRAFGK